MQFVKKGFLSNVFLILLCVNIAEYALFHVYYLNSFSEYAGILSIVRYYISEAWSFIMPALIALLMLISYAMTGKLSALLAGLVASLPRVGFYLFYDYLKYISEGFDSVESILLSLVSSIGAAAMTFVEAGAFFIIAVLILSRFAKKHGYPTDQYLKESLPTQDLFDIGVPSTMAVASVSLSAFILRFVFVLANTVIRFIDYGLNMSSGEVITTVIDFLIPVLLLVLTHLLLSAVKKHIVKTRFYEED